MSRCLDSRSRIIVAMTAREWTFLSNHGHVLTALGHDPQARTRDVAQSVGITERAVQLIVRELVDQGYLEIEKVGRRNRYLVIPGTHLRHPLESRVTVGEFLNLIVGPDESDPAERSRGC